MGFEISKGIQSQPNDLLNRQENENTSIFMRNLQYTMQFDSPHFGRIKLYKMTKMPHQYVMMKKYTGLTKLNMLKDTYSHKNQQKNIVPADYIHHEIKQGVCGKHPELSLYCRYYNFTLKDAIERKINLRGKFTNGDILYTAKTLLQIYKSFNAQSYLGIFKSDKIFISPQGFLRIYQWNEIWRLQQQEYDLDNIPELSHNYSQSSSSNYNPQEVQFEITQKDINRYNPSSQHKSDLKDIALIIMEMITQGINQECFHYDQSQRAREIITFTLNSGREQTNKPLYIFREFLRGVLFYNWGLPRANQQLKGLGQRYVLNQHFSIKLNLAEGQQISLNTNRSVSTSQPPIRQDLKKLFKSNLVAGKITSVRKQEYRPQRKSFSHIIRR